MFIAIDRNLSTKILQDGYIPTLRNHVPAATSPERAKKAWGRHHSGDPVVLKVVNEDGSESNGKTLLCGGRVVNIRASRGGYRILTQHLRPNCLRQYSSKEGEEAEVSKGYFCIPYNEWESVTELELNRISGVSSQKKARQVAAEKHPNCSRFKLFSRGIPNWWNSGTLSREAEYFVKTDEYWYAWSVV